MALGLKYATKEQALSALRDVYKTSTGVESLRLAAKLKVHMDAGDFVDSQVQSSFGFSVAQLARFKSRLQVKANTHALINAEVGE